MAHKCRYTLQAMEVHISNVVCCSTTKAHGESNVHLAKLLFSLMIKITDRLRFRVMIFAEGIRLVWKIIEINQ